MSRFKMVIRVVTLILNLYPLALVSETTAVLETPDFSGHQNEKWSEVQSQLEKLKAKVVVQTAIVNELLANKKQSKAQLSNIEISTLNSEHLKLKKLTDDYNSLLSDFQFRFPEKGLGMGRKYIRLESHSIQQMENSPSIEKHLKTIYKKISKQYPNKNLTKINSRKEPTYKPQKIPVGSKGLDTIINSENSQVTDQHLLKQ